MAGLRLLRGVVLCVVLLLVSGVLRMALERRNRQLEERLRLLEQEFVYRGGRLSRLVVGGPP